MSCALDLLAHRVLECLDEPFAHDGNELRISATLGLAMASDISVEQELSGIEVLLRHADGRCFRPKRMENTVSAGFAPGPCRHRSPATRISDAGCPLP